MTILHVPGAGGTNVARLANGRAFTTGATATDTGAISSQMIRLVGSAAFCWKEGTAVTATNGTYMAAGSAEYFAIPINASIAFITATGGDGTMWVSEVI